jgi:hypothetical protein
MTNTNTNTTTPTAKELVMRTMIAELKIMNIKLDMLEQEIDEKLAKLNKAQDECLKDLKFNKI